MQIKWLSGLLTVFIVSFCVVGSGLAVSNDSEEPVPLKRLKEKNGRSLGQELKEEVDQDVRFKAIRETATTLAVQTAVRYQYSRFNEEMESLSRALDKLYDFSLLLAHDGAVQPPVIVEANNALQIKSSVKSVSSRKVYKIIQDAKIVSVPPTWRHYLIKKFDAIESVNSVLLPRTPQERSIWRDAVVKGWSIGIQQAQRVFDANLNQLNRDFMGLVTYQRLAAQGIIGVPMVAEGEYGVKIRDKVLDVDQRIFRITQPAKFNEVDKWQPIGFIKKSR